VQGTDLSAVRGRYIRALSALVQRRAVGGNVEPVVLRQALGEVLLAEERAGQEKQLSELGNLRVLLEEARLLSRDLAYHRRARLEAVIGRALEEVELSRGDRANSVRRIFSTGTRGTEYGDPGYGVRGPGVRSTGTRGTEYGDPGYGVRGPGVRSTERL
jgi:hypothetical protein